VNKSPAPSALPGRRQQAAKNDQVILQAARQVFLQNPTSPVSAVAAEANVGISALYRRYPSKEHLLARLCHDGLLRMMTEAEAVADVTDPGEAFREFLRRVVDADVHSLTMHLAGLFTPTPEMRNDAIKATEQNIALFEAAQAAGEIRADAVIGDVEFILESCAAIRVPDPQRTQQLRQRHLALQLDGLSATNATGLPEPKPVNEMQWRWKPRKN
jgi:AcrR family transcriptional regulator